MRKFLVDNQLPDALARWLVTKGCQADHVLSLQLGRATDGAIWQYAAREGYGIVSKDEDFMQMSLLRPEQVTVVWLRIGNCRVVTLLTVMEQAWPAITAQLDSGVRLIEVH